MRIGVAVQEDLPLALITPVGHDLGTQGISVSPTNNSHK